MVLAAGRLGPPGRYDLRTGELLGQVTSGQWAVRRSRTSTRPSAVVYFTASGLVDEDPYRRTVCRVGLDGSGFAKVTDDELDHIATMPDTMEYFIDSASTVDTPPVTTVRDWAGRVLVELERADITKLTATGWTPPERFRVKAADGVTDIYGVLYRPRGSTPPSATRWWTASTPARRSTGSPRASTPAGWASTGNPSRRWASWWSRWMGEAPRGGAVLPRRLLRPLGRRGLPGRPCRGAAAAGPDPAVDGPGPGGCVRPLRRRVRHSAGDAGLPRGVQGRSRPLRPARRPLFNLGFVETYDGADNPEAWARASNGDLADRLAGKLLLIHGEMDDQSTRTTRCGWPTGSSPPTRTSSCSSCPGPSTRSSTAWPTSASAAGTSWCAS